MAQTPDTILLKLKELQAAIPGIETQVARLQSLLKAGFGGSEGSLAAANIQLQNMAKSAETAIAAMSDVTKTQTAMANLKTTIAEVNAQLDRLSTKHLPAGTQVGSTRPAATREFDQEYTALQASMNADMQARAAFESQADALAAQQIARKQEQIQLEESAIRVKAQEGTTAQEAAQQQIAAIDRIILKQRELLGVGESGRYFGKSTLVSGLNREAGGAKKFQQLTGMSADDYFDSVLLKQQQVQANRNTTNAPYKFTEVTPESARAKVQEIETLRKKFDELGYTADQTKKKLEAIYSPQGQRLAPGLNKVKPPNVDKELEDTLKSGGLEKFFGDPKKYDAFQQRIKSLGIDLKDLKRATTDVASGVTTLSFEGMDKSMGTLRNATVYVDEFGRVITQGTSKVKTLEEAITQNISKVMTWALALGVVYGSMQKIGELVESMKKIQDAMADISITTKKTADDLDTVYEAIVQISQATATDLTGGLTAFNQALRATGSAGDEAIRTQTGLRLLADSLTLAKLAGIDTKRAMDLLIAGLKQLNQPLDSGGALLDKFQAISNQANSSMEDMATTFAITAGAADDVGVKVNDLVALIGAFSEATSLSATETGNALRAMFSNFTQPQAVETLNKYGIAVQDINGEFKSFIDVFQQASELARSGVLSERQVSEIANALGGGSRRQAQVTALLTVAPRQQDLKEFLDQGKEAGAVQDAMAKKTDTLSSATERLQNAFDNFGKTLGTSGGFIDALTSIVELFTKVIDLASQLTKTLGPGLPMLLAGVAGLSLLKTQGPVLGKFASQMSGAFAFNTPQPAGGAAQANNPSMLYLPSQAVASNLGQTFGKNALTGLLPILPLLAGKVSESLQSGDWSSTVGMGVGTAFLGILSGNPLWGLIGGLIGQALVEQIVTWEKNRKLGEEALTKDFALAQLPKNATGDERVKAINATTTQLQELALQYEPLRLLNTGREKLSGYSQDEVLKIVSGNYQKLLDEGMNREEAYSKLVSETLTLPQKEGNIFQRVYDTSQGGGTAGFKQESLDKFLAGVDLVDKALVDLSKVIENGGVAAETALNSAFVTAKETFMGTTEGIKSATQTGELIGTPEYEYNRKKRYEFTSQLTKGELGTGDYKSRMESLQSSGLVATNILTALNPNINKSNVEDYKNEWIKIKDAVTIADQGTQTYLSQTATSLTTLNEEMVKLRTEEELFKSGLSNLDSAGYAQLQVRIKDVGEQSQIAEAQMRALLQAIEDSNNAAKFSFKGFADYSKYSKEEMQGLIQAARGMQDIYAQQTNSPLDQLIKTAPDIVAMTEDGFHTYSGVYQQFLDQVLADVDDFRTRMEEKMKFNFKSLRNVPAEMAQRLQQAMNYYTNLLKQYGMNERNELITVLFKDNQVGQLVGSQTALQLALEDLTEVEKKQLDGIYNLPSGATAYIPLQAGQLLSQYTQNTAPVSTVDYGNTPTTPPPVGSYPLGTPPSEMSMDDLLKKYLEEHLTDLQKQAIAVGKIKYPGASEGPNGTEYLPENRPYWEKYAMGWDNPNAAPGAGNAASGPLAEFLVVMRQMYSVFAPIINTLKTLGLSTPSLPDTLKSGKVSSAEPVKINITQEKQTHEVTVAMNLLLDSRRLWEGIKKVAMADYAQMTASIGNSQRSRGNVV